MYLCAASFDLMREVERAVRTRSFRADCHLLESRFSEE